MNSKKQALQLRHQKGKRDAGIDSRQEAAKTAVIAGGTSGIGLATAMILQAGYRRMILDGRDAERGARQVELVLKKNQPVVSFFQGDASSEHIGQKLIDSADEGIDLFVNAVTGDTPRIIC